MIWTDRVRRLMRFEVREKKNPPSPTKTRQYQNIMLRTVDMCIFPKPKLSTSFLLLFVSENPNLTHKYCIYKLKHQAYNIRRYFYEIWAQWISFLINLYCYVSNS